jgi:hypothetical protein
VYDKLVSNPTFDGLCGIPSPFTTRDGLHLRCKFEMGHGGDHDWKKYKAQFRILGGITWDEVRRRVKKGSPAARAMLGIPLDCRCTPIFSEEGNLAEYLFDAKCPVHAKP